MPTTAIGPSCSHQRMARGGRRALVQAVGLNRTEGTFPGEGTGGLGGTGLRWGEAAALRRRSIDLVRRRLIVTESLAEVGGELTFGSTKSHAERSVPLTSSLAEALEKHLDERVDRGLDELVFTSEKGHPLRYSNFRREVWSPAVRSAKVPKIGLHVLRHSAAAAMISAGALPKTLQAVLGHQSAGFTMSVYGHVFDEDLDALADRLEEILSRRLSEDIDHQE